MAEGTDPILGLIILVLLLVCVVLATCIWCLVKQNILLSRSMALYRLASSPDQERVAVMAAKKLADDWPRPARKLDPAPLRNDPKPAPDGLRFTTNL